MATPQQLSRENVRRRNIRNGTLLALTQTVRLANFPLAQEVGAHVQRLIVGLKPDVLQAPKDNDTNMQTLAEQIGDLMDMLEEAQEEMNDRVMVDIHKETTRCREQFKKLHEYLGKSLFELQSLYDCRAATKFVSQTEIHERIMRIKDELGIRLTVFNLNIGLGNTQTTRWLAESLTRHLEDSDKRIERLEEVYAMQPTRNMDGRDDRGVAYFVFHHSAFFFYPEHPLYWPKKEMRT